MSPTPCRGWRGWRVEGLPVQGYDLPHPALAILTFGENWHDNHHAFAHSARLGVEQRQPDPGFWLVRALERPGLAHDVRLPASEPPREGPVRVGPGAPQNGPSSSTPSADIWA